MLEQKADLQKNTHTIVILTFPYSKINSIFKNVVVNIGNTIIRLNVMYIDYLFLLCLMSDIAFLVLLYVML